MVFLGGWRFLMSEVPLYLAHEEAHPCTLAEGPQRQTHLVYCHPPGRISFCQFRY